MELIGELQKAGAIWAINTGRLSICLKRASPILPSPAVPILFSPRSATFFGLPRTAARGKHSAIGTIDALATIELFSSASSVLAEVIDFVNQKTQARMIYEPQGPAGLIAQSEEEMDRVTEFIEHARKRQPKLNYQRNTVYLRFCHADYHKGAALAELARLIEIPREQIFAAGDHHNDVSMLDGKVAAMPACPGNAISEVKEAVRVSRRLCRRERTWRRRP